MARRPASRDSRADVYTRAGALAERLAPEDPLTLPDGVFLLHNEEQNHIEVLTGQRLQRLPRADDAPEPPVLAAPEVTSLDPASLVIESPGITLRVLGTGFADGSEILWDGSPTETTFVSETELTTNVGAGSAVTSIPVAVKNLDGQVSNEVPFAFTLPPASPIVITSLAPDSTPADGTQIGLFVFGTDFVAGCVIVIDGVDQMTELMAANRVACLLPPTTIPATVPVFVRDPDGLLTNTLQFTYDEVAPLGPPPVLTAISPSGGVVGGPAFTMTLTGTGFGAGGGVSVQIGTTGSAGVLVSPTEATIYLTGVLSVAGVQNVFVMNYDNQSSNALPFTVTAT